MPKPHHQAERTKSPKPAKAVPDDHPPPEDELGGGDFVSPEVSPATEDDRPLE